MLGWMLHGSAPLRLEVDSHRDQAVPLALEEDARQRPLRRPREHPAVLGREISLMAGALEAGPLGGVGDGAGEVGALLAVGREFVLRGTDQDAGSVRPRIVEQPAA